MNHLLGDKIAFYKAKLQKLEVLKLAYEKKAWNFSMLRLGAIVAIIPTGYLASYISIYAIFLAIAILIPVFIWAVLRQQHYDQLVSHTESLIGISQNEVHVIEKRNNIYSDGSTLGSQNHFYADDFDILGPRSLFSLLNRAKSFHGIRILAGFLLNLNTREQIESRQLAVKELASDPEWMQDLQAELFKMEDAENTDVSKLIHQTIDIDLAFSTPSWLVFYVRFLPFIWPILIGLYFVDSSIAEAVATLLIIGNILLTMRYAKVVTQIQQKLSLVKHYLQSFVKAFYHINNRAWTSPLVVEHLHAKEKDYDASLAISSIERITDIIEKLDFRLNLIATFILNGLLLWDIKYMQKLAKWKDEDESKIDQLFDLLGLVEALGSLGVFAFNNESVFIYPTLHDDPYQYQGKELQHPLMNVNTSVANDFVMIEPHLLSIITGSNMSGKSTYLRTIGINMVLAYAGTRVIAKEFNIPVVQLVSYMRIKDALEENVSTFKAELNRIELIISMIKQDQPIFILIDEMLRGTNSKDKLNGSMAFTRQLIASKSPSIIATHDVKLAELEFEYPDQVRNYFFDIEFEDQDLVFDYKIRNGICETFNASHLLKQLGIDTDNA